MVTIGLLAMLLAPQDTLGLSPRARAMLDRFVPPVNGEVTVAARFSDDTVWLGEQVELVTATWFPRTLREQLRRQPSLRTPALSGLWSAPAPTTPELADTRRVSGIVYDLFVSHQTLFPLGAGVIEAPPAVLSYAVPSSSSFFAPEERKSLSSRPARLVVRAIPAGLAARLGSGPTARDMRLRWLVPTGGVAAGVPITVELVLSGRGNVSLWPAPDIDWPANLRVYVEPTEERLQRPGGIVAGEKHFRFTLVPDSTGVLTLPRVRYPHFDPDRVQVALATATPVGIAVRPAAGGAGRVAVSASTVLRTPLAATIVRSWWPLLTVIALAPVLMVAFGRRPQRPVRATRSTSVEERLRALIGEPADATPLRVEAALRRRGISRAEASRVRAWLEDLERHRWSASHPPRPDDAVVSAVISQLAPGVRSGLILGAALLLVAPLGAQWDDALARYRDNDVRGAERLFAMVVEQHPAAPDGWLDLGAARWLAGDDVGSVAAWLQGLRVAPRDARLHGALHAVPNLPPEIRGMVPVIPLSRDELVLVALVTWLLAWGTWSRRRRLAWAFAGVMLLSGGLAIARRAAELGHDALVRPGVVIRRSPIATAAELAPAPAWSVATLQRRDNEWWLVDLGGGRRGWLPATGVAPLSRLD